MSVDPRQKTWEIAQKDPEAAVRFAREVGDDWYRCQSLAYAAWHIKPKKAFLGIANEALEAARALREPNRIVSCSAWPVRAMARRGDVEVLPVIEELLLVIGKEPNPVRRAHALLRLFEAIYSKNELREMVLQPLLAACREMKSWRQPGILRDLALVLAEDDPHSAARVVEMIGKKSARKQAVDFIERRHWLGPSEFFPYYTKPV